MTGLRLQCTVQEDFSVYILLLLAMARTKSRVISISVSLQWVSVLWCTTGEIRYLLYIFFFFTLICKVVDLKALLLFQIQHTLR